MRQRPTVKRIAFIAFIFACGFLVGVGATVGVTVAKFRAAVEAQMRGSLSAVRDERAALFFSNLVARELGLTGGQKAELRRDMADIVPEIRDLRASVRQRIKDISAAVYSRIQDSLSPAQREKAQTFLN